MIPGWASLVMDAVGVFVEVEAQAGFGRPLIDTMAYFHSFRLGHSFILFYFVTLVSFYIVLFYFILLCFFPFILGLFALVHFSGRLILCTALL